MGVILHLVSLLACLQTAYLYPTHHEGVEGSSMFENYGMRLAKRPFYPYRGALMAHFGLLANPKMNQEQRKKAVDSTFIRFGRSSSAAPYKPSVGRNERSIDEIQENLLEEESPMMGESQDMRENPMMRESSFESAIPELKVSSPPQQPRFLLDHAGCRIRDSRELMRALLSDPNCIRAFQKAKKENVNDTFIRFGKREAPPEKEFQDDSMSSAYEGR